MVTTLLRVATRALSVPAFLDQCFLVEIYWEEVEAFIPRLPGENVR